MPILIPSRKIACFDTPKAASSSIKVALCRRERGEDFASGEAADDAIHRVYPARDVYAADYAGFGIT